MVFPIDYRPKYHDQNLEEDSDDDEIEKRRNKLAPLPARKEKPTSGIVFSSKSSSSQLKNYTEEDRSNSEMEMSDSESENDTPVDPQLYSDPRMRRIMQNTQRSSRRDEPGSSRGHSSRHRDSDDEDDDSDEDPRIRRRHREVVDEVAVVDESDDNEEDVEGRHDALKRRLQDRRPEYSDSRRHQVPESEDDESDDEDDEEEDEESEDDFAPRLKPVFVSKKDRITILEKEAEEERRLEQEEADRKLQAEERRRQAKKLVEDERKREEEEEATAKAQGEEENLIRGIQLMKTDDEDEETATELWKVRELRRLKRDKEEDEAREKEKDEVERMRNMTEEERLAELAKNPKKTTNQQEKGDYKYMQKYYHRGAFYLDQEDKVFKRDFAQPTLEDHFDKSSLPAVMQVKNFGLAGRTKYTHLTDQDTTAFDQGWGDKKNDGAKSFHHKHAAGMKQNFDRPSKRKRDD